MVELGANETKFGTEVSVFLKEKRIYHFLK